MLFTRILSQKKWQLTARFFSTSYTTVTTTRALIKTKGHPCRYMGKITPGLLQIAISQAGNPPKHPSSGLANKSTEAAFSCVSLLKFGVNGTEHSNNLLKDWTNSILWVGESQAALIWLLGSKWKERHRRERGGGFRCFHVAVGIQRQRNGKVGVLACWQGTDTHKVVVSPLHDQSLSQTAPAQLQYYHPGMRGICGDE